MSLRFDAAKISNYEELPDGRLRVMATISRVGDLRYLREDGTIQVETVPPETLFDKEWLDTVGLAPVTLQHPPVMVSPENYKQYAVGSTGSKVIARQDEGLVDVVFVLGDKGAIDSVKSGRTRQVSAGYTTKVIEREDGKFCQTDRRMNHVALVQRGRAGETVRLHFDAADEWGVQINADEEDVTSEGDSGEKASIEEVSIDVKEQSLDPASIAIQKTEEPFTQDSDLKKDDPGITQSSNTEQIPDTNKSDDEVLELNSNQAEENKQSEEENPEVSNSIPEPDQKNDRAISTQETVTDSIAEKTEETIESKPVEIAKEPVVQEVKSVPIASKKDTAFMKKWKGHIIEDEKLFDAIVGMEEELNNARSSMKTMKKNDEYEAIEAKFVATQSNYSNAIDKLDAAEKNLSRAEARADTLQLELDRMSEQLNSRMDTLQVEQEIQNRLMTWEAVKPFLGRDAKYDTADTVIDMKRKAIAARNKTIKLEGKNDAYIETVFETMQSFSVPEQNEEDMRKLDEVRKIDEVMTRAQISTDSRSDSGSRREKEDDFDERLDNEYDALRRELQDAWKGGK